MEMTEEQIVKNIPLSPVKNALGYLVCPTCGSEHIEMLLWRYQGKDYKFRCKFCCDCSQKILWASYINKEFKDLPD